MATACHGDAENPKISLKTKTDGLAACLRFGNPLQFVLARLFFRKSRFVPHRLGGAQFVADQSGGDECGLRPCLVEGMYDPFLAAAGISNAGAPLDIADFGANAGGSRSCLRQGGSRSGKFWLWR